MGGDVYFAAVEMVMCQYIYVFVAFTQRDLGRKKKEGCQSKNK